MTVPTTLPDARACVCPAPDDEQVDAHCAHDACPACGVLDLIAPCWALVIADIVDECTARVSDNTGRTVIMWAAGLASRIVLYVPEAPGVEPAVWLSGGPPIDALDGEHPETLDDARWIAASWLATLPRTDRTEGVPT